MVYKLHLNKAVKKSVYFLQPLKIEPQFPLPLALYFRRNNLYLLFPHGLSYQSVVVTDICHFSGFLAFESISKFGETHHLWGLVGCLSHLSL